MRQGNVKRTTRETDIEVKLTIDGDGEYDISTGIGFLDHMLEQLSRHGGMDIFVRVKGDLHIDGHHTTEDCGIAMGQAFREALGDKKGITRYGHAYLPMDETLARAALDISGRPFLVWNVPFTRDKIGEMDTELFQEWFRAFAFAAGLTLHVDILRGENNHHMIEACYKALALSIKTAAAIDPRNEGRIPSTKGKL